MIHIGITLLAQASLLWRVSVCNEGAPSKLMEFKILTTIRLTRNCADQAIGTGWADDTNLPRLDHNFCANVELGVHATARWCRDICDRYFRNARSEHFPKICLPMCITCPLCQEETTRLIS